MATRTSDTLAGVLIAVLLVVVLLPVLLVVLSAPMVGMMGGYWGQQGVNAPLWTFAPMLVVLLLLAGLGFFLVRAVGSSDATDPAMGELRMAYARGDITDEEFETRRQRLRREQ
jgi:putative membrane protein